MASLETRISDKVATWLQPNCQGRAYAMQLYGFGLASLPLQPHGSMILLYILPLQNEPHGLL